MKKILSAILAVATLSTAASAIAAPGWAPEGNKIYGGFQIGLSLDRTKFSASAQLGRRTVNLGDKTVSKTSMPLGGQIGWMYSMPADVFAALELGGMYNFFAETKAFNNNVKLQKSWAYEVMPKFGYQFNDEWAAYLLCGIGQTAFKLKLTTQEDTKKVLWNVAPGAGVMYKLDSQWSTSVEYKFQMHEKFEKKVSILTGKAEPRSHVFTWKLNYAFA